MQRFFANCKGPSVTLWDETQIIHSEDRKLRRYLHALDEEKYVVGSLPVGCNMLPKCLTIDMTKFYSLHLDIYTLLKMLWRSLCWKTTFVSVPAYAISSEKSSTRWERIWVVQNGRRLEAKIMSISHITDPLQKVIYDRVMAADKRICSCRFQLCIPL